MTASVAHRLAWVLLVEAGCGLAAPEISTAATCRMGSVPVVIETGVTTNGDAAASCRSYAAAFGSYRATFQEGWGPVTLEEEQWSLRVRAGTTVDAAGHTGITYHHARVVDVAQEVLETLPHELRHVQLGRGSDDHHGWCSNFAPWEEEVLGVDERGYLGCPR